MRAVAWVILQLSRLFAVLTGLFVLGLGAALLLAVLGEDTEGPAPFGPADASLGTYVWQVLVCIVVLFGLWRGCVAFVYRYGSERAAMATLGLESEYDDWAEDEQRTAYMHQPPIGRCSACGFEFRSWDEALDHAEYVHGHDQLPEEARALLVRY